MSLLEEFAKQLDIIIYCDDQFDFSTKDLSVDDNIIIEYYFTDRLICTYTALTNWSNIYKYTFTETGIRVLGMMLGNVIGQRTNEKINLLTQQD